MKVKSKMTISFETCSLTILLNLSDFLQIAWHTSSETQGLPVQSFLGISYRAVESTRNLYWQFPHLTVYNLTSSKPCRINTNLSLHDKKGFKWWRRVACVPSHINISLIFPSSRGVQIVLNQNVVFCSKHINSTFRTFLLSNLILSKNILRQWNLLMFWWRVLAYWKSSAVE